MFADNVALGFLGLIILYWVFRNRRAPGTESTQLSSTAKRILSDLNKSNISRPTRSDIYHAAFLLQQKLPPELVPQILDYAEYWLQSSVAISQDMDISDIQILGRRSNYLTPGATYLSTLPIGEVPDEKQNGIALVGQHPVRKVVFTIESQDQGWSSFPEHHGTERDSWSWFETSVREPNQPVYQELLREREEADLDEGRRYGVLEPPPGREVCRNIHAGGHWRTKVVSWSVHDGDEEIKTWLEGLVRGQVIDLTVWARYPGWRNRVKNAWIDVYLATIR